MIDKELFSLLGSNKKYIAYTVLLMIVGLIANIGITACLCYAIFLAILGSEASAYIVPAVSVVLLIAIRFVTTRAVGNLRDLLGRTVKKDLRHRTYDKILRMGVRSADEMNMAGLTQVSLEGIEQLDMYFSTYLPQFFFSVIAPLILFGMSVGIEWKFAVVLLACVPIIPISIILVSKYAKRIFNKYWGIYTSMGDGFLDSMQGLNELKIFAADEARHKRINEKAEDFRKITMKVLVMQLASITIMDLIAFGGAGAGVAVAVVGMSEAMSAGASTAELASKTLFLILIAVEFFLPLRSLGSAFHVAMNGISAGKKLLGLLDAEEPKWGSEGVENTDLALEDVTFTYDGRRNVVDHANITFPAHGMTAIVGESGSGKSTIVNLLIGALRPKEGEILVGGKPLESVERSAYYSHVASVSYNTYIFNDTIRNNFRLAKSDVAEKEIWHALERVNLDKFVRENGGLDKVILEDANNVSGGQKQRLALAINLVADKDIYIFDEATSNIDVESENIIMTNVKEMSRTKNIIVISHRLENVVPADNIYYMSNGKIRESGTHAELMQEGGGYAELYRIQKELEEGYKNYLDSEEARA